MPPAEAELLELRADGRVEEYAVQRDDRDDDYFELEFRRREVSLWISQNEEDTGDDEKCERDPEYRMERAECLLLEFRDAVVAQESCEEHIADGRATNADRGSREVNDDGDCVDEVVHS